MTFEEIFSKISAHMAHGVRLHNKMAVLFGFLNLKGFQRCQEYHFLEETKMYYELQDFYLKEYDKMIEEESISEPDVIPSGWYKYKKEEVDVNNKRSAVKDIMKKWVDWEKETKLLLASSYKQLNEIDEINSAKKIACYLKEVSDELAGALEDYINLDSLGYDIVYMVDIQQEWYHIYSTLIEKINEDDAE